MEYWNNDAGAQGALKDAYLTDTIGVLKHVRAFANILKPKNLTDTIGVLKLIYVCLDKVVNRFNRYNWSIETLLFYNYNSPPNI